jgi:hypothetical protein
MKNSEYKLAILPGDGIGPEVVREAKKVLQEQDMRPLATLCPMRLCKPQRILMPYCLELLADLNGRR